MKRIISIIILTITMILLINSASSVNNNPITKEEILHSLIPDKHIEIDTIGSEKDILNMKYIIRFMEGEKEKKRMEVKMKYKKYKEEYLDTVVEHSARIEGKAYKIKTIHVNRDSIYENPEIYLSPNRSKILIIWEEVIKRNITKIEKIIELDTICRESYYPRGYRRVSKIEIYNERGNKLYERRGEDIGWKETKDWFYGDPLPENYYRDINNYREYFYKEPYLYVDYVYDSGECIVSNTLTEGYNIEDVRIINQKGEIIFERAIRAWINYTSLLRLGENIYFTYIEGGKSYIEKIGEDGNGKKKEYVGEGRGTMNMDILKKSEEEIILILDVSDNVYKMERKEIGKELIYYSKDLEEKKREIVEGDYVFRGSVIYKDNEVIIYPYKQSGEWNDSVFKIYYIGESERRAESYKTEYYVYHKRLRDILKDSGKQILIFSDDTKYLYYIKDRENKELKEVK